MKIDIHFPCYNEALLIEHAIQHYRTRFPDAVFHVHDNHSTDSSVEIAKRLGCIVTQWGSPDEFDVNTLRTLQNTCWKSDTTEWVIMCDMDEWICITDEQLSAEALSGTTIIRTNGYSMIGESLREDLSDISLHEIRKGVYSQWYSKRLIFNAKEIGELNSGNGAHWCYPSGNCTESTYTYVLKHMDFVGKKYKTEKNRKAYIRSERPRSMGQCGHHLADQSAIEKEYDAMLSEASEVDFTPQK